MIALDAMGGDYAPTVTVQGAINAAKKGIKIGLYGDQAQLHALLDRIEPSWQHLPISIIHCSQIIDMGEEPTRGVLRKKDASLVRAIEAVAQGNASAIVSAGNSGAALVAGSLIIGRAEGVIRPALGDFLPETSNSSSSLFCMDMGANIDCKPEHLEQFAYMGHAYVKQVKGIEHPRIALLSNGAEPYKGPALVKKAYDILSSSTLNFVGNLEARDVFEGRADVLVCDGFSGNILIKAMQGTAYAVRQWLKQERDRSFINRVLFTLSSGIFAGLSDKMSYAQRKGGMLMLGLKAPLIVAHGSSSTQAIENAIHLAYTKVQENFIASFNREIALVMAQKGIFHTNTIKSIQYLK
jgi:glycerol-3-phosphate acyltransferase PlsX